MSAAPSLQAIARALVAPGKGILAADESLGTIGKRFAALNIPCDEKTRRDYRALLCTTPDLTDFISGVILFTETLAQTSRDGLTFPQDLDRQGIIPGIKVDAGTREMPAFPGEKFTVGLDGLRARLVDYHDAGARFTKWRAVIAVGRERPSLAAIETNARMLALFAATSQEAGLVPIVEPEVLMAGDHSIDRCEEVTKLTLERVFACLVEHRVALDGMLLKTGMILPGINHPTASSIEDVATATMRVLRQTVPPAVPGIVFLSGGQSDVDATRRLNEICRLERAPWPLSFSFGRALQNAALKTWSGQPDQVAAAQAALHHRANLNSLAVQGLYTPAAETSRD